MNQLWKRTYVMLNGSNVCSFHDSTCSLFSQIVGLSSMHSWHKHVSILMFNIVISMWDTKAIEWKEHDPRMILQSQKTLLSTSFSLIKWKNREIGLLALGYARYSCCLLRQNEMTSTTFCSLLPSILSYSFLSSCLRTTPMPSCTRLPWPNLK
jgi:hypothetical protein